MRGHKYLRDPLLLQRVPGRLRPVQGSCGWEWAFEGKPNIPYKIYLAESELPTAWYNVRADMKNKPAPLLNPGTLQPMTAKELDGVFCDELVQQELDDTTAYIPIPDEIREYYRMYRPSPLCRAYRLEEALGTPAKIYYKFEGNNTSGSHKLNSAIAQAYYAKKQALKCRETGEEKTIVFGLTGTGCFDMVAYEKFHDGQMSDYIPTDADLQKGFDGVPRFPGNEI